MISVGHGFYVEHCSLIVFDRILRAALVYAGIFCVCLYLGSAVLPLGCTLCTQHIGTHLAHIYKFIICVYVGIVAVCGAVRHGDFASRAGVYSTVLAPTSLLIIILRTRAVIAIMQ